MSLRSDWTLQCIIQGHLCSGLFTFVSAQLGESRRRACEKLFPVYIFPCKITTLEMGQPQFTKEERIFMCQKYLEYKDMVVGEGREIFQGENFRERLFIPFSFLVKMK